MSRKQQGVRKRTKKHKPSLATEKIQTTPDISSSDSELENDEFDAEALNAISDASGSDPGEGFGEGQTVELFDGSESESDEDSEKKMEIFPDESDANSSESDSGLTGVERAAAALDAQKLADEAGAADDLKLSLKESAEFVLPSGQQIEKEKQLPPDLTIIDQRIQDIIHVLSNFRTRRGSGTDARPRSDYVSQLARNFALYYGYSDELIEMFLELFSPAECREFLEANEVSRPMTIRTNTLKTRRRDLAQALINRGVNLDPLAEWSKVGLKVFESQVPIGATPEYLAGHYMLQSASSFMPVMALAPQENERVVDMCAAPGGKSTYIAALMKNTGVMISNDSNRARLTALVANFHRMGIRNSIVTNYDGRKLGEHVNGVDRVLLDAPCTGLGVISRDPSIKLSKTRRDVEVVSKTQKELILAAIDMIDVHSKTGGILVYSTCSIMVEENEAVVNYALNKRHVQLLPTGAPFGVEGVTRYRGRKFHPSLKHARRYYPHAHNMDGFFVARLRKMADGPRRAKVESEGEEEVIDEIEIDDLAGMVDEDAETENVEVIQCSSEKKVSHKSKKRKRTSAKSATASSVQPKAKKSKSANKPVQVSKKKKSSKKEEKKSTIAKKK
eukprot:398387_1